MCIRDSIVVDQGTDFNTTITVTDNDGTAVNLTGYTGEGQIRKHYASTTKLDFSLSFNSPRSGGEVVLALNKVQTANLEAGRYVYDVELTSAANTTIRLAEGIVTVTPQVTR